ncbi:MAG TPA: HAD-IA family hydrolase [Ktedonobacterales bacterium]
MSKASEAGEQSAAITRILDGPARGGASTGASSGASELPARRGLAQPQSVRAIFFDVGYTLLEPAPSVVDIAAQTVARMGFDVDRACLDAQLPAAEESLRRTVKAAPQTWGDNQAIAGIWQAYYTALLRPCFTGKLAPKLRAAVDEVCRVFEEYTSYAPYPDVVPVLRLLHARDYTLGVISDWGIGLGPILHAHGLNHYFDFAVVSAALRHAKPHPWLFETALRRADAIPDYAVHIGDSYVLDILGARTAGIAGVLIDRRGTLNPANVDVPVVRDLYGLLDLLEIEGAGMDDIGGA